MNINDNDGIISLTYAALNGHDDVAKFLVDKGADMNIKNNFCSYG